MTKRAEGGHYLQIFSLSPFCPSPWGKCSSLLLSLGFVILLVLANEVLMDIT